MTTTRNAKRKERKEKKVSAILHESVPVRLWDEDLGPDAPRLFTGSMDEEGDGADPRIELERTSPRMPDERWKASSTTSAGTVRRS